MSRAGGRVQAIKIEKVAVIGAGVMGSGIAAHVANAGVPVVLLDIVADGAPTRSAVAEGAVARMLKADPSPFMHPATHAASPPATWRTTSHGSPTATGSSRR